MMPAEAAADAIENICVAVTICTCVWMWLRYLKDGADG